MSTNGEITNTYVELIDGTNVKFHATMADASGGDFDKWGFFYNDQVKPDDALADTPKDVIADTNGGVPGATPACGGRPDLKITPGSTMWARGRAGRTHTRPGRCRRFPGTAAPRFPAPGRHRPDWSDSRSFLPCRQAAMWRRFSTLVSP